MVENVQDMITYFAFDVITWLLLLSHSIRKSTLIGSIALSGYSAILVGCPEFVGRRGRSSVVSETMCQAKAERGKREETSGEWAVELHRKWGLVSILMVYGNEGCDSCYYSFGNLLH